MTSITLTQSEMQDLYNKNPFRPQWHNGKLLSVRKIAVDPLTYRAYFDAKDLTPFTEPEIAEKARSDARFALNSHYTMSVHRNMLKIKSQWSTASNAKPNKIGGKRGDVVGFSRASRKRMIEFVASARYDTQALFATLTYPDFFPYDERIWRQHFEAFRRRFERQFPAYRCIWRIEVKPRKSGRNRGKLAPHFHLIIFTDDTNAPEIEIDYVYSYGQMYEKTVSPISRSFETWAKQAWYEIVNSVDEKHAEHGCFVVAVRNEKHAMKYVSKYVAKEDDDDYAIGRRWGRIGTFDTQPSKRIILSRRQYIEFKRLTRKWMKSKGRAYHDAIRRSSTMKGITIFGLGDGFATSQNDWFNHQLVYRMLEHIAEITKERVFGLDVTATPNAFSGLKANEP